MTDVVAGILAALRRTFELEVFNLGNTHPHNVSTLIRLLERCFDRRARRKPNTIRAGDVPVTYADNAVSKEKLGFSPKVSLRDDTRHFAHWYAASRRLSLSSRCEPSPRENRGAAREVWGAIRARKKIVSPLSL